MYLHADLGIKFDSMCSVLTHTCKPDTVHDVYVVVKMQKN